MDHKNKKRHKMLKRDTRYNKEQNSQSRLLPKHAGRINESMFFPVVKK
jgi:hypothetical protein